MLTAESGRYEDKKVEEYSLLGLRVASNDDHVSRSIIAGQAILF